MNEGPRETHLLYVELDTLLGFQDGKSKLNEVLDQSLLDVGKPGNLYATDIAYRMVEVNAEGLLVIEATYTPVYE